ncbi:holin-associated N-acetylmuramidase [Roseinatronobacter bogoriensis]|uniref:Peptidoglycan-binding protein n=1 Tax=Roseinatronobacter bogoriensis subsp. barguzinensis TaxID=441209 RepID=A0A2K8KB14_9RHOB|nr:MULTISPECIES: holin-associated N-acetylmuramidase [Rhodobaca]ATX65093.1 peptidoglycan-binding protein [Rhodobaca barguzinensis]MBB4209576.1 lysozyme family protein [Rhodobaca bogoriensis DSM 18756]TDW35432.1 putative peptidoglycan binding protein [Rhodobaca barguzinensis]TDY66643.1 putative peptidoglycan binding protein [Rhodobaca bogoriensis DSM 18756]
MKSVRQLATQIVAREGGFVNDPDDPGGATNFGVTIHTLRRLRPNQRVTVQDVRDLTRAQAIEIYIEHYFTRPRIAELPEPLWPSVFDMYVNAGANAVRILQRLLVQMGIHVAVDGIIGPQTIAATHRAYDMAPAHLVDAYGIARRDYYYAIADRRPASRKFARRRDGGKGGWITRAEEFINPRFHLSAEQHRARTRGWA